MTEEKREPSTATLALGFLVFNGLFFLVVVNVNLALLLGTLYYPKTVGLYVTLPYLTYVLVLGRQERKGGAHWPAFSKHFPAFGPMRRFLGMKLLAPKELTDADKKDDKAQFMFAVFPHGSNADYRVLMDGMLESVVPRTASRTRTLAASVLFRIPVVREVALWTGAVDASRSVADKLLDTGHSSVLVTPGGLAEQIRTVCGREIVYLRQRKGFLKLAMKHGVAVVPCYVFGASDYYYTSSFLFGLRLWLVENLGVAIPLAFGMFGSLTCPRPVQTTIVFGKPMQFAVKEAGAPTSEELNEAHEQFCEALRRLFDEHKPALGYGDRTLEIM